jgi:hypothetical protein
MEGDHSSAPLQSVEQHNLEQIQRIAAEQRRKESRYRLRQRWYQTVHKVHRAKVLDDAAESLASEFCYSRRTKQLRDSLSACFEPTTDAISRLLPSNYPTKDSITVGLLTQHVTDGINFDPSISSLRSLAPDGLNLFGPYTEPQNERLNHVYRPTLTLFSVDINASSLCSFHEDHLLLIGLEDIDTSLNRITAFVTSDIGHRLSHHRPHPTIHSPSPHSKSQRVRRSPPKSATDDPPKPPVQVEDSILE